MIIINHMTNPAYIFFGTVESFFANVRFIIFVFTSGTIRAQYLMRKIQNFTYSYIQIKRFLIYAFDCNN